MSSPVPAGSAVLPGGGHWAAAPVARARTTRSSTLAAARCGRASRECRLCIVVSSAVQQPGRWAGPRGRPACGATALRSHAPAVDDGSPAHDEVERFTLLREHAEVGDGIAIHDEQVGERTGAHDAELPFLLEECGV